MPPCSFKKTIIISICLVNMDRLPVFSPPQPSSILCLFLSILIMIYLLLLTNYIALMTSLVAQTVKHLPTEQETWVQSMGREDLLEKGMATHSGILAHPPIKRGLQEMYGKIKEQVRIACLPLY